MKRSDIPDLISCLLILMFTYAAASKLIAFSSFKIQMLVQPVPKWSVNFLVYAVPIVEVLTILLLLFKSTKTLGLYFSALLMLAFSIYVGLAMTGMFGNIPCSCGGIIRHLHWPGHFIFNLIFLSISIYGIYLNQRERRFIGK
ncbi:MauE/DoxX family redox-associated membrane protein [Mucilaginibacter sp. RCC_168]|uniref:MauE/DoxX family redox-associated membrane protein n=1 Tax=Mucilaginibacter sp. RCC_168 TaxID=3239221 RepID=UPI003524A474